MNLPSSKIFVSLEEASSTVRKISSRFLKHRTENLPLEESCGRILARDVYARFDVPPFHNSSMDGFALRSSDIVSIPARLKVAATIPAGSFSDIKLKKGECARIMTGSPMPSVADAVVMKEFTRLDGEYVLILKKPQRGENVRYRGEDIKKGALLVKKGVLLSPPLLGLLAAQGSGRVDVFRRPLIGFITTGNEVVMPGKPLATGKIYNVNRYTMSAALADSGCEPLYLGHCTDSADSVVSVVKRYLPRLDALITIGGVSMGEYDVVKDALKKLGARFYFEKIWMKPGRPTGFAVLRRKPVFTLPGNVVSSLVAFDMVVRPAVSPAAISLPSFFTLKNVRADFSFSKDDERRHILRVRISQGSVGKFSARPSGEQGSGILSTLAYADGYVIIPEGKQVLRRGSPVNVLIPRSFLRYSFFL